MRDAIDAYYKLRIQAVVDELKAQYPELTYPLNGLKFEKRKEADLLERTPFSTDGRTIFYDEKYIEKNLNKTLKYDLMHIVLHGLLGHFQQQQEYENKQYRDICMDVQVTYLLEQLGMSRGPFRAGGYQWERKKQNNPDFSMSQYYSALKNEEVANELWCCSNYVYTDDHAKWAPVKKGSETVTQPGFAGEKPEKERDNFWKQARTYAGISDGKDSGQEIEAQFRHIGQKNAKECQYGNQEGDAAGRFKVGKESEKNYLELLHELTTVKEVCREQPDTIDPMLYQYGFELNAGSPLMEPAEYSEQTVVNLAIAVDVSGSCANTETMMKFWGETYRCISQWSGNRSEAKFLLLQCDADIKKEEWISAKDFTEAPEEISVSGFGGTSFVPVFKRIEQLTEEGCKIDALLYLTDGEGRYPEEQPGYPVYFILPESYYDRNKSVSHIPDWIQTVRLER